MPTEKPVTYKVFAYITHGRRLLVFRHIRAPQAGIQVPAGTLLPGEKPEAGVLREAQEETGRTDLDLVSFLGEQMHEASRQSDGSILNMIRLTAAKNRSLLSFIG
jgi:ADP-ribose pyrophosphatase YjhB (NUDIX family)